MPCRHTCNVIWCHSGRKVLQDLNNQNDDRIGVLEEMVKDSQSQATEAERKFEEVGRAARFKRLTQEQAPQLGLFLRRQTAENERNRFLI